MSFVREVRVNCGYLQYLMVTLKPNNMKTHIILSLIFILFVSASPSVTRPIHIQETLKDADNITLINIHGYQDTNMLYSLSSNPDDTLSINASTKTFSKILHDKPPHKRTIDTDGGLPAFSSSLKCFYSQLHQCFQLP